MAIFTKIRNENTARLSAPVTAAILFLCSCASPDDGRKEATSVTTFARSCLQQHKIEVPSGETIYDYTDNGAHYFCAISFSVDSLYSWSYVKDSTNASPYALVDVTAAALKDIDAGKTEASEYDLDLYRRNKNMKQYSL